jgi:hypothetical protein
MERLTILLILLFVILFIGQAYTREYFVTTVDISNSTLTMSLTDLLYAIGSERTAPDSVAPVPPAPHEHGLGSIPHTHSSSDRRHRLAAKGPQSLRGNPIQGPLQI